MSTYTLNGQELTLTATGEPIHPSALTCGATVLIDSVPCTLLSLPDVLTQVHDTEGRGLTEYTFHFAVPTTGQRFYHAVTLSFNPPAPVPLSSSPLGLVGEHERLKDEPPMDVEEALALGREKIAEGWTLRPGQFALLDEAGSDIYGKSLIVLRVEQHTTLVWLDYEDDDGPWHEGGDLVPDLRSARMRQMPAASGQVDADKNTLRDVAAFLLAGGEHESAEALQEIAARLDPRDGAQP